MQVWELVAGPEAVKVHAVAPTVTPPSRVVPGDVEDDPHASAPRPRITQLRTP